MTSGQELCLFRQVSENWSVFSVDYESSSRHSSVIIDLKFVDGHFVSLDKPTDRLVAWLLALFLFRFLRNIF